MVGEELRLLPAAAEDEGVAALEPHDLLAGAVGGWWAGKAVADATHKFTQEDDSFYRERFENRSL